MTYSDDSLRKENYWNNEWTNVFDHYQQDIRHAYYIRSIKNKCENKLLEIAAGSFRDMRTLCKWGILCEGIDYSSEAVDRAKKHSPELAHKIQKMDAFNLTFTDNFFDLSFHNGVWGYFDDTDILKLAHEQARVTRSRIIATVHNAHNIQFKNYFDQMKKKDPLYSIRFFTKNEMIGLMSQVCSSVTIIPVGKRKKYHEDFLIKIGLGNPLLLKIYFKLVGLRLLNSSERLMCIGSLQKA